jgi:tellurite resistance protein
MTDAYAPAIDPVADALSRLVSITCEDAIFGLSAALGNAHDALEELVKRRKDAHQLALNGQRTPRMVDAVDAWVVDMARAMAPICPPSWMPMAEVLAEKVTLEVGARGLRSLFSSKPSDKDVLRVKRLGSLTVRVLRAVFAADGPIDGEEARTLASFIASLGLPEADATPLYTEAPMPIERLEVYGDIDAAVARAMLRGAWLAAALDVIDPREEQVVRALATKLNVPVADVEYMRNEAIARVDARRMAGLATVDAVRYVLSDRVPGLGVDLAAHAGTLMLPRRFREEALAQVKHGAPVVLAQRYKGISGAEKTSVLGIAWAAALHEDPSISRQAIIKARLDRVAQDLRGEGLGAVGIDPQDARRAVDDMLAMSLAEAAAIAAKP